MKYVSLTILLITASAIRADNFERLSNADLSRILKSDGVKQVAELSASQLNSREHQSLGASGAVVLFQTRGGRLAKIVLQAGMQKLGEARHPMILIERFVTFKEGDERTVVAKGGPIQLFNELQFNLDLGQVVPKSIGGDLEVTGGPELSKFSLRVVAPAKMYLLTKAPSIAATPAGKFVMGESFEPRFFNGAYTLHDDGRRSGKLQLEVDEAAGVVTGSFYSDKDGRKYEVTGKLGAVRHQLHFTIRFPQSEQHYQGFMFTGDGRAIAGTSTFKNRETGFYAIRMESPAN